MPGTQQSPSCSREPWETAKDDDMAKLPPLPAPLLSPALSHPQRPLSQGKGAGLAAVKKSSGSVSGPLGWTCLSGM